MLSAGWPSRRRRAPAAAPSTSCRAIGSTGSTASRHPSRSRPRSRLVAERPLVPTARESALGRTVDVLSLDAPRELVDDSGLTPVPLPRRVIGFVRSLDPRLLGAPLLPLFALGFVTTIQNWD